MSKGTKVRGVVVFLDDRFSIADRDSELTVTKALWHPPPHYLTMAQLGFLPVGRLTFTARGETIGTDVAQIAVDIRSSGRMIVRAKTVRPEFRNLLHGRLEEAAHDPLSLIDVADVPCDIADPMPR